MGPCEWDISDIECPSFDELDPEEQERLKTIAVEYLWNWTGQAFGLCETVIRPCKQDCWEGVSTFGSLPSSHRSVAGFTPTLIGGKWFNLSCGVCGDKCGCSDTPLLDLPGPVESVDEVLLDGEVLDPSTYRVDSRRFLVRLDGERWPTCQDMGLDVSEPGTWQITYTRGIPVPEGGKLAAAVLACEFSKVGTKGCRLPQRVQSITRQGVSMTFLDTFEDIDKGHTGIWEIDSWVSSVMKRPRRSTVLSPDYRPSKGRHTTWRAP